MKKILVVPVMALMLALGVFSGSALAGPPEWAPVQGDPVPPSDGGGIVAFSGPPEW
ncbi:hypothetical protein [Brevibacillus porteri]|uniref:hypothetical protein n=1 Tax=Brevibacillus porteri TaxID=2126350 RepID=UPI001304EAA6|nr:hypothetical protein [Brevibacillus porteri]MED1801832.1 hypothetical protein [Brevibacillus porteri]MED2134964.1 hypothetical protein [Brevibacillus porteri]MED2745485.1 hypothetical protein [Brevibacillus porteri]MED2815769.1 hypothetical protein [Brevibacillus porteri]MED2897607.1 hypothetical protein [Brevibacillus porteri]